VGHNLPSAPSWHTGNRCTFLRAQPAARRRASWASAKVPRVELRPRRHRKAGAGATADGYTIIVGNWGTHVVNGAIYKLQYDVVKDFEPISLFCSYPLLIVAKNGVPATDLTGLIDWLKANPKRASAGIVVPAFSYFFQSLTGTQFQLITYRGTAPAMQDLVAGNIDMMFADPATSLPQVRAGRIKAFAVMSVSRLTSALDIPTVDEAGLPGFYGSFWIGLWAPKGTPRDIIHKLNAAAVDALADATVGARLADIGQEIFPRDEQTPEALAALQKAEIEKWCRFSRRPELRCSKPPPRLGGHDP